MTVSSAPLLVEFQEPVAGLGRSLPSAGVLAPKLLRQSRMSGFRGARTFSRPFTPAAFASAGSSATGKKRFNTQ
jgi:hypothetical protein